MIIHAFLLTNWCHDLPNTSRFAAQAIPYRWLYSTALLWKQSVQCTWPTMACQGQCYWQWEELKTNAVLSASAKRKSWHDCEIFDAAKPIQWLGHYTWSSPTRIYQWVPGKWSLQPDVVRSPWMQQDVGSQCDQAQNDHFPGSWHRLNKCTLTLSKAVHRLNWIGLNLSGYIFIQW